MAVLEYDNEEYDADVEAVFLYYGYAMPQILDLTPITLKILIHHIPKKEAIDDGSSNLDSVAI